MRNPFPMRPRFVSSIASFGLLLLPGCASNYHDDWIPQDMLSKIDSALTFEQIKEAPYSHIGTTFLLGGEVLMAKRMKDHTRLMILQLPLADSNEPVSDRMQSQGRFLAHEQDFLDPAIVPEGSRVTIVGTVSGSHTEPIDEMEYTYPTITIEHLKVWPQAGDYPYGPYPYRYRYYGYGPYSWYPYYYGPYSRHYYW